jgi:hypothetical protein
MYCPKCSQQQVSDSVRFCSRCGFPLNAVVDLLAHDGVLAALEIKGEQLQLTSYQNGARQGKVLMIASLVVTFIAALLSIFLIPELFIPLTGVIIFLCGILRILYAYIFERGAAERQKSPKESTQLNAAARDYLPTAHNFPVGGFSERGVNTAEMVAPPSVTEHTTKLLKDL